MGASGWTYFAEWQDDVSAALQALRQQIFREGRYGKAYEWEEIARRAAEDSSDPTFAAQMKESAARMRALETKRLAGRTPATIQEALDLSEESGTHSILDIMNGISAEPLGDGSWQDHFGKAFAVPEEWLLEAFNTLKPTRKQVEEEGLEGAEALDRWQCVYFAVWEEEDGKGPPRWWCFEGCSGD